jgi:hypothetical protein
MSEPGVMQTRIESLDELHRRLEDLLRLLDGPWGPRDDASRLERALESCRRRFAALQSAPAESAPAGSALERAHRARLEQVLRLNAVCLGRLESEADLMGRAIAATRDHARRLPALRSRPESGASCDVSC